MIKLKIGSKDVEVDGIRLQMDTEPFLKDSRTFVPIRFVAEGMGLKVEWLNDTQEVIIYDRKEYFETADACAFDWAMHWNTMSIAIFKEIGGIIYKNDKGYYWDNVKIGQDKEVFWDVKKVREGVAFIHTHSGGRPTMTDAMSSADKSAAKKCDRPLYMADSGGNLWVYDPNGKKQQELVESGLPVDARYVDIKESSKSMNEYFAKGYHDLYEFDFGYKADYYNKLFMKGLNYYDERAV